jgi:hypothetical protein
MEKSNVTIRRRSRVALLVALLGILITSSGLFCLDYLNYQQFSISLKFVRLTPQIPGSQSSNEETAAYIDEVRSKIRSRMLIDAAIVFLGFYSLWCIREVKPVREANSEIEGSS